MTLAAATPADRDGARGMALFAAAMLIVPAMDALAKLLGATLSPAQIGFIRYAIQTAVLVALLTALGRTILTPEARAVLPKLALAGFLMGLAVLALFWSLQYLPLANAIAIFFVEPLILTLFSAWFLRESIGWHRIGAVAVGLVGALVVLRPNLLMFGWAALLPLVAATSFAGLMTIIRSISGRLDGLRIQTLSGAFAALVLGLAVTVGSALDVPILRFEAPSGEAWALLLALGLLATVGQMMMTLALKFAEASLLAPFQYLEIVSATALGYLVFGDFPDPLTWVGTAIILSAGLYVVHRERRRARSRIARAPLG